MFAFESFDAFIKMGGYGVYVWSSVITSLLLLLGIHLIALKDLKTKQQLARSLNVDMSSPSQRRS